MTKGKKGFNKYFENIKQFFLLTKSNLSPNIQKFFNLKIVTIELATMKKKRSTLTKLMSINDITPLCFLVFLNLEEIYKKTFENSVLLKMQGVNQLLSDKV